MRGSLIDCDRKSDAPIRLLQKHDILGRNQDLGVVVGFLRAVIVQVPDLIHRLRVVYGMYM